MKKKNRATPFAKKLTAACYFGDLSSNCTHLLWHGVFQNTSHQQCCLAAARATQEGPCSPTLHNFTGTGVFFQGNIWMEIQINSLWASLPAHFYHNTSISLPPSLPPALNYFFLFPLPSAFLTPCSLASQDLGLIFSFVMISSFVIFLASEIIFSPSLSALVVPLCFTYSKLRKLR